MQSMHMTDFADNLQEKIAFMFIKRKIYMSLKT